ncbi:MAG: hypothetical protein JW795_07900 [Chitinivibrionales bacterium]|nr:hypothetical protein [Chitinivibrionales bacterium]
MVSRIPGIAVGIFLLFCFLPMQIHAVTITEGTDQGQNCFIITTADGQYFYQKEAGAFSSILDVDFIDWIGYSSTGSASAAAKWRGLPNLSTADSIGCAGSKKCISIKLNDTTIQSISVDSLWQWHWVFSETKATMTITKVKPAVTYSFSYRGPPSDKVDSSSYWGTSTNGFIKTKVPLDTTPATGSWQWAYVGNQKKARIFYIAQNRKDTILDYCKWIKAPSATGMALCGFGIDKQGQPLLTDSAATFTIGFLEQKVADSTSHATASRILDIVLDSAHAPKLNAIAVTSHWIQTSRIGGWGDIVRYEIENDSVIQPVTLHSGNSFFPKINLEATQVAFFHQNGSGEGAAVAVMNLDGSGFKNFENSAWKQGAIAGFLDWPQGRWIYYSVGEQNTPYIFRVHADSGQVEKVLTFKDNANSDTHPWLWSMSADGKRMVFRANNFNIYYLLMPQTLPQIITLKPQGGEFNSPEGVYGCQHNISASGDFICFGPAGDNHTTIRIKQWWDCSNDGCFQKYPAATLHSWKPTKSNLGGVFNENQWSNNNDDWICANEQTKLGTYEVTNVVAYNWRHHRQVAITANDGSVQHFDVPGDLHVDTTDLSVHPGLKLQTRVLSFTADSGITNPLSQTIMAVNYGSGQMDEVSTRISYNSADKDTGWLAVQKGVGTCNLQSLVNTVSAGRLSGGIYTATVLVNAANVRLSKLYTVKLTISTKRRFSAVALTPKEITLSPGAQTQFTAVALDQYHDTLVVQPTAWLWQVDTPAVITSGLFECTQARITPYHIKASTIIDSIMLSDSALARVELPPLTILAPNGKESFNVADTLTVLWTAFDTARISSVALDVSLDNGRRWFTMNTSGIDPHNSSWGKFQWVIPRQIDISGVLVETASDSCRVKVRDYQYPQFRDVSDSVFSIKMITAIHPSELLLKNRLLTQPRAGVYRITIPVATSFSFSLFTANGRKIITQKGVGPFDYLFSSSDYGAGIYIITLSAAKVAVTRRLLFFK